MTNKEIIMQEQIRLADEGVLKVIGTVELETEEGTIIKMPKIQPIHTYNAWKSLGYQVKKGEKAVVKFAVWHWSIKKNGKMEEVENEENTPDLSKEKTKGRCYMRVSAFFTDEQVEKIEKED